VSLVQHALSLIKEINEEIALPPNFQHRFRTPPKSTEPKRIKLIRREKYSNESGDGK